MKIRRLDISGFKSFADPTLFSFDDGVTGIVGPNGCGKSNVVDAIRWVMGEQSPKQLRGRGMEDVIFNGSETRPAQALAEVSLTFQNDGRGIPPRFAGFGEITVTRRLLRSGESDYLINKTQCRLMDITELFLGTGVGARAYSIIEQGRIGLVVSAKAEDRRSIIEEAAGVTKYKARKKSAERKLEATQQNLLRISDLVGEIGKQLEGLRRQARKAERYKTLRAEQRELELLFAVRRHQSLAEEIGALTASCKNLSEEMESAQASVATLEGGLAAKRLQVLEDERHLSEITEKAHAADKALKLTEQNLVFFAREMESTRARADQHRGEQDLLESRRTLLEREREQLDVDQEQLASSCGEEQQKLRDAEEALRAAQGSAQHFQGDVERERAAAIAVITRLANHRTNLAAIERRRNDLAQRYERAKTEATEHGVRAAELGAKAEVLALQLSSSKSAQAQLDVQRQSRAESLARLRTEQSDHSAWLQKTREELATSRSRLTSLLEIQRSMEGYGHGVRHMMSEPRPGILGLVADVVRTERTHEQAIEAVLGERLQWIVVESRTAGVEATEYLQRAAQGRASFIPLQLALPQLPEPAHAGVRAALDVVSYDPQYADVVKLLLGDVYLVDTLAEALARWAQRPGVGTFVTASGEVMSREGVVSGGTLQGTSVGLLGKRREVQELATTTQALEASVAEAQARAAELANQVSETETALHQVERDANAAQLTIAKEEREHAEAAGEQRRVVQRRGELEVESAALATQLDECSREESHSKSEIERGESEQKEHDARLVQLHSEVARGRGQVEQSQTNVTRLKIATAAAAERQQGLQKAIARVAEQRTEVEARLTGLARAIEEADLRAAELKEKSAAGESELKRLLAEGEKLRDEVSLLRTAYDAQQARLGAGDDEVRGARATLDALSARSTEETLRLRERELSLTALHEQVRERHHCEIEEVAIGKTAAAAALDEASAQTKLVELKDTIERMGEVNLIAIEEAETLGKRHAFLSAQKKDLEDTITQLTQAMARIDRASKARFKETFDLVNERFQQVFPRLFRGGTAQLSLVVDPTLGEDAEPGVEIEAQPPGKKLVTVNLLSGGEKALTAISLIFAIFLIKPTPFCLLDEVDAPLDEANVGRYNELVREMAKSSQFIVITHNKRTMEIADALYGVTMEDPGCSKIVSVKLSQRGQTEAVA